MSTCVNGDGNPINRDGVCFACKIKTVGFGGITRLKAEREANTTQAEMGREIIAGARRNGTEIERAR